MGCSISIYKKHFNMKRNSNNKIIVNNKGYIRKQRIIINTWKMIVSTPEVYNVFDFKKGKHITFIGSASTNDLIMQCIHIDRIKELYINSQIAPKSSIGVIDYSILPNTPNNRVIKSMISPSQNNRGRGSRINNDGTLDSDVMVFIVSFYKNLNNLCDKPIKNIKIQADLLKYLIVMMTITDKIKFNDALLNFKKMMESKIITECIYNNINNALCKTIKEILDDKWTPLIGNTWDYMCSHILSIIKNDYDPI